MISPTVAVARTLSPSTRTKSPHPALRYTPYVNTSAYAAATAAASVGVATPE